MKVLLWLDDVRNPFVYDWLMRFAPNWDENREYVVWVKNYNEFCDWIETNGLPEQIAFDHDLSDFQAMKFGYPEMMEDVDLANTEKTGMDCAKFLVEYCLDEDLELPKWVVQSANPVGTDNINGLLNSYKKFRNNDN